MYVSKSIPKKVHSIFRLGNQLRRVRTIKQKIELYRDLALKIIEEEKCGTTQLLEEFKNKKQDKNQTKEESMEVDENTHVYTCKIKTIFEPFLRRLFEPLRRKKRKLSYQKSLIECLVQYEGFCPRLDLNHMGEFLFHYGYILVMFLLEI